jgi:hypothetical protein
MPGYPGLIYPGLYFPPPVGGVLNLCEAGIRSLMPERSMFSLMPERTMVPYCTP